MIKIIFTIVNIYNLRYLTYFITNTTQLSFTLVLQQLLPDTDFITSPPESYIKGFINIKDNLPSSELYKYLLNNIKNLQTILEPQNIPFEFYINNFDK